MKIKNSSPKIKISLCIICTLAFILSVSVLFAVYQRSLNEQFEHMETENLTASALNQSQYVSTLLAGLQGRMSAAAELLSTSSVEPDGEWTADYLEQLCDSY